MLSRENVTREALSGLEAQRAANMMEEKRRRAEAEERSPAVAELLARRQRLFFSGVRGAFASPQKAKEAFERWGVDAIMVGRATFGHPWIFKEMRTYLDTGELMPEPSVSEKVALAKRHLALSLELKGEPRGIFEMRRHLSCYFKGLPDFKETRMRMVTTLDVAELYSILDEIEERYAAPFDS